MNQFKDTTEICTMYAFRVNKFAHYDAYYKADLVHAECIFSARRIAQLMAAIADDLTN